MNDPKEAPDRRRYSQVDALLDQALDLPSSEREGFLRRTTTDPALAAEVLELVSLAEAPAPALDAGAAELLAVDVRHLTAASPATEELLGEADRRLGPWRLLQPLGEGGMSRVYLAERADGQFEQRVALKLIKGGLSDPESERRFRQERQILARLEHPNISRLLDGGVTAGGAPWFALELVEGAPLTDHTRRAKLGLKERLRLFLEVCGAVEYAHHNFVVHRDLKPSNILVARDGTVKLLDFGIAKLLAVPQEGMTVPRTGTGVPMTPEYAAPEQLHGDPVSTATDVYSLGVVLFELLTGILPFRQGSTDLMTLLERAKEPVAPKPSDVMAASDPRLSRRLEGDLDAIVAKALDRQPEKRYPTAEALARDLRRFLRHAPVEASGDALAYRASRFLRRFWLVSPLVAVAFGTLSLGLRQTLHRARAAEAKVKALEAEVLCRDGKMAEGRKLLGEARDLAGSEARLDAGACDEKKSGPPLSRG